MNKIYTFYSFIACLILGITSANAYTFTWNGSASTNWNTAANWTVTGTGSGNTIPGSADDVVINNGSLSNQPVLQNDLTIDDLVLSAGKLTMAGYLLTVDEARFTGGTVENGWIDAVNFVLLQNTTFDAAGGALVLNKTAGVNNDVVGGNTFKGPLAILNSSTTRFRLGVSTTDVYQGLMHYEERSSGALEPAYNGTNIYPADLSTQGSSNLVSLAMGNGGRVVLTGTTTLLGDQAYIQRLIVNTNTIFSLQGDLVAYDMRIYSGNVDLNGNNITVENDLFIRGGDIEDGIIEFNDIDTMENATFEAMALIKTGGVANTVRGGNTFNGQNTLRNNDNNYWRLATVNADDYNGDVLFIETNGGGMEPAYNGSNTFAGEISTLGSTSSVEFGGGNGVVVIDGDIDQTFTGNASTSPIVKRLTMNTSATLFLGGINLTITGQLNFTEGIIASSPSNMLMFADDATAINASNSSHVAGPVRKIGNDAFTFPTGTGTVYGAIGISAPSSNAHFFTAEYIGSAYSDLSVGTGLDHVSNQEHWMLNRNGGTSSNVSVTLHYNFDRSGPINNRADLRVARHDGTTWVSEGQSDTTGTPGNGTITSNTVTSFSPFTLGSSSSLNPLPISLLSFNAIPVNTNVLVKWSTSNETNNNFFTVERSLDGRTWSNIGIVKAAGNSFTTIEYQLVDRAPVEGLQFYRLKQTDLNGEFTYSNIVPVKFNAENNTNVVLFPQPAGDILNVSVQNTENLNINIKILNAMGQQVLELNNLNGSVIQIDLSTLTSGVYYMELNLDGAVTQTKLIKQ